MVCVQLSLLYLYALALAFLIFVLFYLFLSITNVKLDPCQRYDGEQYFVVPTVDPPVKKLLPVFTDPPSIYLSVIVPAYNEEKRLPLMLDECIDVLELRLKENSRHTYEIIIVDDGSMDDTTKVGLQYCRKIGPEKLRVITLVKNRGKGGAVRLGMLSARGKYLLFADADGATKFSDIQKLEDAMEVLVHSTEMAVVVGSRSHLEKQAIAMRSAFRTFLMYGFHTLVWLFGVRNVKDTQCGFKLFTRKSAVLLFTSLHVERWAFDVELLYIANQLSMVISEVAVNWTEIEGSKLVPFWSWVQMGTDLVLIWIKYQTRIWTIKPKMS